MAMPRLCALVALWGALAGGAGTASADEALARKSGCLECHRVDEKLVGPAYRDVARRYAGDARARAALIRKVTEGGKGNWTEVTGDERMPPHGGRLSAEVIARLVDWVLSLQSQPPPTPAPETP